MCAISTSKNIVSQIKRMLLRVPAQVQAEIFAAGNYHKEVFLDNISSGGVTFYVAPEESPPDVLDMSFQLQPAPKIIRPRVEVKSRIPTPGGLRIGCRFSDISPEDKDLISNYVCQSTDLSLPIKIISMAGFLSFLDALWRISAFILYYAGLEFERIEAIPVSSYIYLAVLLLYASTSALSFTFSSRLGNAKERRQFFFSLSCLAVALVFIAYRTTGYFVYWITHADYLFVSIFVWLYLLFAFYIALAIWMGITWRSKIHLALEALEQHRLYIKFRGKKFPENKPFQ